MRSQSCIYSWMSDNLSHYCSDTLVSEVSHLKSKQTIGNRPNKLSKYLIVYKYANIVNSEIIAMIV